MGKIVYDKLIALMKERGLTTYQIRKQHIITEDTLQRIRKNRNITMDSVAALCEALHCQPGDILEYIPDEE